MWPKIKYFGSLYEINFLEKFFPNIIYLELDVISFWNFPNIMG